MAKFGEGHAKAMARQGFKEIARVLPAFPQSSPVIEEPGVFGNPTQQEVSKQTGVSNDYGKNEPNYRRENVVEYETDKEPDLEPDV